MTNAIRAAETVEQQAFASYGTFVAYQETVADLVESPTATPEFRQLAAQADTAAKPLADALFDSAVALIKARAAVDALDPDDPQFATKVVEMNDATDQVRAAVGNLGPALQQFAAAIREGVQ